MFSCPILWYNYDNFFLTTYSIFSVTVQHECIPQAVLGMDVLCQAKSGMGKTAVFVLATLQQLEMVENQVSVLVLCHTRELAFQISKEYERFSKYMTTIKVRLLWMNCLKCFTYFVIVLGWCILWWFKYCQRWANFESKLPPHCCWNPWSYPGAGPLEETKPPHTQAFRTWRVWQNAWSSRYNIQKMFLKTYY